MTSTKPDVRPDGRYSIKDAAFILGVSRRTIYNLRDMGLMPVHSFKAIRRSFVFGKDILRAWGAHL